MGMFNAAAVSASNAVEQAYKAAHDSKQVKDMVAAKERVAANEGIFAKAYTGAEEGHALIQAFGVKSPFEMVVGAGLDMVIPGSIQSLIEKVGGFAETTLNMDLDNSGSKGKFVIEGAIASVGGKIFKKIAPGQVEEITNYFDGPAEMLHQIELDQKLPNGMVAHVVYGTPLPTIEIEIAVEPVGPCTMCGQELPQLPPTHETVHEMADGTTAAPEAIPNMSEKLLHRGSIQHIQCFSYTDCVAMQKLA
jgi:hypothetical protein